MKKLLVITGILLSFTSCEDIKTPTPLTLNPKKNEVEYDYGNGVVLHDVIYEVEYKGHTYGYTQVHGDQSYFHAGHCKCNQTK